MQGVSFAYCIVEFMSVAEADKVKKHKVLKFMGRDLNVGDAKRYRAQLHSMFEFREKLA